MGIACVHKRTTAPAAGALLLLSVLLGGCATSTAGSSQMDAQAYALPSMPTMTAATKGIAQAVAEEKLTGPIEMSDLRQTDHGPGRFMLCIRAVGPKDSRAATYAVFFDNDDYKGTRMSVIMDYCEKQAYQPYIGATAAPSATPPTPVPAPAERHHRNHQQLS
jgi:hypothetical protein